MDGPATRLPPPSLLAEARRRGDVMACDCPSRLVMNHLTSRWGVLVLIALETGTHRFSQLRRAIGGISERMLAQTLHQLESDGLVQRHAHDVVPPHVDYTLTPLGQGAAEKVRQLTDWVELNIGEILAHRRGVGAE